MNSLFLHDRIALRDAPDVLAGQVLAARDAVRQRVQGRIAAQVVSGAVKLVGARLHLHADHAAGAVAELGVDGVLLQVHFLHRVHGRRVA